MKAIIGFIWYNFIFSKPERGIIFSGLCRGYLHVKLFMMFSDFSSDTFNTLKGHDILITLFVFFCMAYFMFFVYQMLLAFCYSFGFYGSYSVGRMLSDETARQSSYSNIDSALKYGDAIMSQKSTFGKVDYLRENPHMILHKDSKNVKEALRHIDTMVGMKPSGAPREKELKKYIGKKK